MSSPRERLLQETIKNYLMGIQKSEEISKQYPRLGKKLAKMTQKEIARCAADVAARVESYRIDTEKRNKRPPRLEAIKKRIEQELRSI